MSYIDTLRGGYTAIQLTPDTIYPNASWNGDVTITADDVTGITFEAYATSSKTSTTRLFDIEVVSNVVSGDTITYYLNAQQEKTIEALGIKKAYITFMATDDASGERFVIAHGSTHVGATGLTDAAISTDIGGLTVADTVLLNSLINTIVGETGGVTIANDLVTDESTHALSAAQGVVLKGLVDGKATSAQGALADSAVQPSDNISVLTNDSGFITGYTVTESDVKTALDGATISDAGTGASGDKVLVQDASDSDSLKYLSFSEFGGGGGVDWSATQVSTQTDGASNSAFKFQVPASWSLGKSLQIVDSSGNNIFYLDYRGQNIKYGELYGGTLGSSQIALTSTNVSLRNSQTSLIASYNNLASVGLENIGDVRINPNGGVSTLTGKDHSSAPSSFLLRAGNATGDTEAKDTTIQGGSAWTSATTNQDGGHVTLEGGAKAAGGGLAGIVKVGTLRVAAPSDSELNNSEMAHWVDESSHTLNFKLKYSDGTVKSASIALT